AVEISEAEVGPKVIDEGLELVRNMWHVGVAHRDVKPANLMVQDGTLRLIDVFFVQVRPSPWRQAVDLANMMLVLALRSDAKTVYDHALQYFTPDEIAEAFAATRGVASPTQLRSMLKSDERDLLQEFRSLAPHRDPIRIQRWSVSLVAQSVPSAPLMPCVGTLGAGWTFAGSTIAKDQTKMWLNSTLAGLNAVEIDLTAACDPGDTPKIAPAPDEIGATVYEAPSQLDPFRGTRYIVFDGGCVRYRYAFAAGAAPSLALEADQALS